jgi:hypothetical protein
MDVAAIPFAVSFPDFIREAIGSSHVLVALVGAAWLDGMDQADDPVRLEIEAALESHVQVLPVLIGTTPMPDAERLPASIAGIAAQNAAVVGVTHDLHAHMQSLLPRLESILGALALPSTVVADPEVIRHTCDGITRFLWDEYLRDIATRPAMPTRFPWKVIGTAELASVSYEYPNCVTLFLHRVARLADSLELHFIVSFWSAHGESEHALSGWVIRQIEKTPILPPSYYTADGTAATVAVTIRRSDEDARQVWRLITSEPLRLSLAYIATVSPARDETGRARPAR